MLLVLTAAALLVIGWKLAGRLWIGLERACAAGTIAFALWLATDWLLALTHTMTRAALIARTVIVVIVAAVIVVRLLGSSAPRESANPEDPRTRGPEVLLVALPILLWIAFVAWRSAIVPPLSHDALSYHLPEAVLLSRAHGFLDVSKIAPSFPDLPLNYELLLADVLTLEGSDRHTEWLNTMLYALFAIGAGALAQRWWRDAKTTAAVMLFTAGAPILLLHSGADKNDLLAGTFMLLSLIWAGRYWTSGELAPLLLLEASLMIAIGTKPQAIVLAAVLVPLVMWRTGTPACPERTGKSARPPLVPAILFGLACVLLLGGATYLDNYVTGTGTGAIGSGAPTSTPAVVRYGDWRNLWEAPYILIAAPFSPDPLSLRVPWDSKPWFWQRYEIYFSHLGVPFALCLLGAPFARAAWRSGERVVIGIAALATLLLMLPVKFDPHGIYAISLPRYILFFAPPVLAWTTGAAMQALSNSRRAPAWIVWAGVAMFAFNAVDVPAGDPFVPFDYVRFAMRHPETRVIPFDRYRATSYVDQVAGPHDKIAVDAAWMTWIHPLFGRELSRPVYFIPPGDEPPRIPDDVDWVVVERAYATIWTHENLQSLADARRLFGRKRPSAAQLRVIEAVKKDRRFKLVFEDPRRIQAIFRRTG